MSKPGFHLIARFFVLALVVAVLSASSLAARVGPPQISKVEPPNWWAHFVSPVVVLLYGENLQVAKISVSYPGVRVEKTQLQPEGKHALVWLSIAKNTKPGNVRLMVKTAAGTTTADFPLLQRAAPEGRFQGVTRDDVIYLIMTDRFADEDPTNNMPKGATPGTYDRSAANAYHGGDGVGGLGTVAYMSPEQVRAKDLDARSDLFSFGAVLYEMASGRMPFNGSSSGEICGAILHQEPPPLSQLNPQVDPGLDAVIRKALEKDLNLRYQSAAEIITDLQRLKRNRGSERYPADSSVQLRLQIHQMTFILGIDY